MWGKVVCPEKWQTESPRPFGGRGLKPHRGTTTIYTLVRASSSSPCAGNNRMVKLRRGNGRSPETNYCQDELGSSVGSRVSQIQGAWRCLHHPSLAAAA